MPREGEWVRGTTLGGKAKPFWWRIDAASCVHIRRRFKHSRSESRKTITRAELDQLDSYMAGRDWVRLAHNVARLLKGTEQDGIGRFLHDSLGWSPTEAQLASHLGALFHRSGVWAYNGKLKEMRFKHQGADWAGLLTEYYRRAI